ncbi:hypothetical protein [Aquimarina spongiae]|uniref:Uncharacterized protein n=1 Tax=Aquimarina spongiae TaxID=570521 RepID=A0A1M6JPM4_9FLAO|nr:hypothetical protein [Aquimarina spongiae]SHJ48596.1 hypothetical protein SAMN04488508_109176 [Aquimarina spongiae]
MNFKKYRIAITFFFMIWVLLLLSFHPFINNIGSGADGLGGFILAVLMTIVIIIFGIGVSGFLLLGLLDNRSKATRIMGVFIGSLAMLNICLLFTWKLSLITFIKQFIY